VGLAGRGARERVVAREGVLDCRFPEKPFLVSDQTLNGRLCRLVDELVGQGISLQQALREFERQYLIAALRDNEGSVSRSASALGVHRNTLRNKIAALDIGVLEAQGRRPKPRRRARR
jgi:DNA-binding NtrC family response regulator